MIDENVETEHETTKEGNGGQQMEVQIYVQRTSNKKLPWTVVGEKKSGSFCWRIGDMYIRTSQAQKETATVYCSAPACAQWCWDNQQDA